MERSWEVRSLPTRACGGRNVSVPEMRESFFALFSNDVGVRRQIDPKLPSQCGGPRFIGLWVPDGL